MSGSTVSWQVVENVGCTNEKLISEWDTFDDAYCAVKELYTVQEEEELEVAILQDWSSDY